MCVAASVPTHKKRVEHTWVYIKTPAAPPGGRPSSPRPRPPQPPPRPLHTPSPQQHPPTPLLANHLDHLARATRVPGLTLCGVRIRGGDERAARCGAPSRPSQGRAFGRPATTAHPQLHLLTDRAHLRSTDNRACQSRRWRQRGRRQAAGQTPAGAAGADGAAAAPAGAALPWPRPPALPPPLAASAGSWLGGAWVGAGVAQGYTDGARAERGGRGEDGQAGHAEHADHAEHAEHAEPNSSHSRWRAGGACLPALAASPSPPGLAAPVHSVVLCAQRERGQREREQQQSESTGRHRGGDRGGGRGRRRLRCGGGAGSAGAAAALLWKWRAELASAPAVCGRPTRFYTHAPKRQGQVGQGRAGTGHGSVGSVRLSAPAHADPEVQPQRALAEAGAVPLGHREALGLERIRVVPVVERPVARRLLQRPAAAPAARALQSRLAQRGLVQRFVVHHSSEPGALSFSISAAA